MKVVSLKSCNQFSVPCSMARMDPRLKSLKSRILSRFSWLNVSGGPPG